VDSLDSQRLASLEVSKWRSGYYQLFRNSKVRNRRLSSRYLRPTCRSGHKVEELESRVSRRGAVLHNSEPQVQRLTAGSTQLIQSYGERWETRDAASENSTSFPCVEETSRVLFTCSWTVEQEELSTSVECVKTNKKRNVQLVLRPTKSNVDNFDHNYDFNAKVIVIGLRVKRSHNFIPRVMRKLLRVNFHNFFITSPARKLWTVVSVFALFNWTDSWANYASYRQGTKS